MKDRSSGRYLTRFIRIAGFAVLSGAFVYQAGGGPVPYVADDAEIAAARARRQRRNSLQPARSLSWTGHEMSQARNIGNESETTVFQHPFGVNEAVAEALTNSAARKIAEARGAGSTVKSDMFQSEKILIQQGRLSLQRKIAGTRLNQAEECRLKVSGTPAWSTRNAAWTGGKVSDSHLKKVFTALRKNGFVIENIRMTVCDSREQSRAEKLLCRLGLADRAMVGVDDRKTPTVKVTTAVDL